MSLTLTELIELTKETALQRYGRPRLLLVLGEVPSKEDEKILTNLDCKRYHAVFIPVKDNNNKIWLSYNMGHIHVISQYLTKRLGHSNFLLAEIEEVPGLTFYE